LYKVKGREEKEMLMESKIRITWNNNQLRFEATLSRRVAATLVGIVLYSLAPDWLAQVGKLIEAIV
jgi:hypothetical protein